MAEEFQPLQVVGLDSRITSRQLSGVNGLHMHVLEAGDPQKPLVLLLHGFPELAYSWRKVMLPLAAAGYYVVAPDQRGYGRTSGWHADYACDLNSFSLLNLVRDQLALVAALGCQQVHCVVGHDFGAPVAAWCALARPDVFRGVALMSAPFAGPPAWPDSRSNSSSRSSARPSGKLFNKSASKSPNKRGSRQGIDAALGELVPPRKHYQWYYSTPAANADMLHCNMGLPAFLRAYYHVKSADWAANAPQPLQAWVAEELARLPRYYVMDLQSDMPATVAPELPDSAQACHWLTDAELAVYAGEFSRTGFQGGLNWYRCSLDAEITGQLRLFAGRAIDVPACFIAGDKDWGIHQSPGALQAMQQTACTDLREVCLVPDAGHWVQQEQPQAVVAQLLAFIGG